MVGGTAVIPVSDVGGTGVRYGIADEQGNLLARRRSDTPVSELEKFLEKVKDAYCQVGSISVIGGLTSSFSGRIHSREGVIHGISTVPYTHEVELKSTLKRQFFGPSVAMANNAKCAALRELWGGVAQKYRNVMLVIYEAGIDGAMAEYGKLYQGVTMNQEEFGNFPMGGFENRELFTWSNYTLERQARKYGEKRGRTITGKGLARLAKANEELAAGLLDGSHYQVAIECIILEFSFDPEIITVGRRISENQRITQGIRRKTKELLEGQRPDYLRPNICACKGDNQASLYGALYYCLHQDVIEE